MIKNKKLIGVICVFIFIGVLIGYKLLFPTYDVIFDSRAGTSIAAQRIKKGERVHEVETPVLKGYTFLGWYLDDEKYDFSLPVTKDITLMGKWEQEIEPKINIVD